MPDRNIDSVTIETYGAGFGIFVWRGNQMVDTFYTKQVEFVPHKPKRKITWRNLLIWRNLK